ncbi:hypothetical protein QYE76_002165 [Lolium multiflorum]|uniref:Uncharacterized protein n=1 Tax=Lolium multiflorum TaxID=4521 RepID=A0AAD8RN32_LOLMU|nr:hypothetical protein QYE76_002165 [Lolium multiflorum]
MIRPCFLPVGMSTSNRIIKPGYESYQPVVAARQLGLGQVPPHFFLHHLTASRAELPDILTGQRCYTFFDALAIPIPNNLCFTTTTDGFETWWTMWKTHAFRRALGPSLKQLDAEHDTTHQEQDGPEPTQTDGSPFTFLPPAPVTSTEENSSEDEHSRQRDTNPGNSERSTTQSQTDSPSSTRQSLLTFDPESIEPAAPKASEEPSLDMVLGPLQRLKALLSSSVETLVENPEAIKGILDEIQPHLPMTLQELESLEEKVRMTKQLIQEKETFIARSREEAQGLTADLKTDRRRSAL